jgi:HEAT repeat protein
MTAAVASLVTFCGDPARREAAATAIVRLNPTLIPLVARGLTHPQPAVRRRIVDALGRVLHPDASAFVVQAFTDEDPIVREMAALAVSRLGNRSADDALRRLADSDPSKAVRRAAAAALAAVRKPG